ncbi:unnamed protein product [Paramecium octaurelia]|uniref:Uncharacterized protein n=1 Tax=Paramecium octaurelia TaxID=43137 RepID=A0A8S1XWS3_PAROT|nr:unnamed protein product [Paramecium octaurelia]
MNIAQLVSPLLSSQISYSYYNQQGNHIINKLTKDSQAIGEILTNNFQSQ